MRRVVVLRPEPGATATVERARKLGLDAVAMPLFEIEPVAWEPPDVSRFDGLLITSANAVQQAGKRLAQLRGLPVHAVGEATAEAALDAGLTVASTGTDGVDAVLASINSNLRLLHLCGEERREPAHSLQKITAVAVYRSRERPAPNIGPVQDLVVLIHSPRAGARFAELVGDRGSVAIAAISPAAAQAVGSGWETVEAAATPSDDALLALAERLCNTLPLR
jgi:uroporphyrinogen-III synthase